jgi:hypothetical protein
MKTQTANGFVRVFFRGLFSKKISTTPNRFARDVGCCDSTVYYKGAVPVRHR